MLKTFISEIGIINLVRLNGYCKGAVYQMYLKFKEKRKI